MKVYVSGPMTGYAEFNYPAFEDACQRLRAAGYEVVSPHEINPPDDEEHEWSWYMRRDIVGLMEAEGVVVLPGWEASRGAALETYIAKAMGMPVYPIQMLVVEKAS